MIRLLAYLNVTLVVNRDVIGLNQTDVMDEYLRLDNGIINNKILISKVVIVMRKNRCTTMI